MNQTNNQQPEELREIRIKIFKALCLLENVDDEDHNESDHLREFTDGVMQLFERYLAQAETAARIDELEKLFTDRILSRDPDWGVSVAIEKRIAKLQKETKHE